MTKKTDRSPISCVKKKAAEGERTMRAYHVVDEAGEEALAGEVGVVLLQVGSLRARAPSTEESAKQDSKMSLAFFFCQHQREDAPATAITSYGHGKRYCDGANP